MRGVEMKMIRKHVGNRPITLATIITALVALAILVGQPEQPAHAQANNGIEGLHLCGYAILNNDMQGQGHIIQAKWDSVQNSSFSNVKLELTATSSSENIELHNGSHNGGVHQFARVAESNWPDVINSGRNDYWIYYVWATPTAGSTNGKMQMSPVSIPENGERSCFRGFGSTDAPPQNVLGAPSQDAFSEPPTASSRPDAPTGFSVELIETGPDAGNISIEWNTHAASAQVSHYRIWRRVSDNPYFSYLNQSRGGMCICRKSGVGLGVSQEGFGP